MTGIPELPSSWAWSTVAEVGDVQLGRQRAPRYHTGTNMRPYLRVANVFEDRIDTADVMSMHFDPEEFERYRLVPGDILLNEGQSPELLGRPAMYRGAPDDVAFTNSLIRFRAYNGVDPEWALTVFRHHMWSGRFTRESRITTNIAHLSANRFKTVEFPVPPPDEQRRIVAVLGEQLSRADAALLGITALRVRLERLRDAARNDVVRQALATTQGATRSAGEVTDVQGGIQKQPGRRADGDTGLPFLRVANVGRSALDLTDVHRILVKDSELPRVLLRPGDLLVVEGNGSPDQIGRAATWDGSIKPCTHQNHLIRVRPQDGLLPEYLEMVWNAPTTVAQLKVVASSTSGLYTLSTGKVKAVRLPVPSAEVQQHLVSAAQSTLAAVDLTLGALDQLAARGRALRRSLLAAAITGKLTAQDPADEPAELLLKRIAEERAAAQPSARRRRSRTVPIARGGAGPLPAEELA